MKSLDPDLRLRPFEQGCEKESEKINQVPLLKSETRYNDGLPLPAEIC